MRASFELDGKIFEYNLTRKSVRNINLRVRGGQIFVSAPRAASLSYIESFLIKKSLWIAKTIELQRRQERAGRRIYLWGEQLELVVLPGEKSATRQGNALVVPTAQGEHATHYLKGELIDKTRELLPECVAKLAAWQVAQPKVTFRAMSSRWGSCRLKTRAITINTRLVAYPVGCLRYVILHELCHFVHPDHSPAFYALLDRVEPEHRLYRKMLKETPDEKARHDTV